MLNTTVRARVRSNGPGRQLSWLAESRYMTCWLAWPSMQMRGQSFMCVGDWVTLVFLQESTRIGADADPPRNVSEFQLATSLLLWIHCSAWINCSRNVQGEGCTFYDLFTQVVQYSAWRQFNAYDGNQQRYNEAIDSLQHLCSNIESGQTLTLLY